MLIHKGEVQMGEATCLLIKKGQSAKWQWLLTILTGMTESSSSRDNEKMYSQY